MIKPRHGVALAGVNPLQNSGGAWERGFEQGEAALGLCTTSCRKQHPHHCPSHPAGSSRRFLRPNPTSFCPVTPDTSICLPAQPGILHGVKPLYRQLIGLGHKKGLNIISDSESKEVQRRLLMIYTTVYNSIRAKKKKNRSIKYHYQSLELII